VSLIARNRRPADEARAISPPGGWSDYVAWWADAQPVGIDRALRHSAVWACQRILVSTVSKMPVDVFTRDTAGNLREITAPAVVARPSASVRRRAWVAQMIRSGVQSGNMYGQITAWNNQFIPTQIESLSPDHVVWRPEDGGLVPYVNDVRQGVYPNGMLWHVPVSQFLMPGTPVAASPTTFAEKAISTGLAAEEFASRFFTDGGHPTTAFVLDNDPGPDAIDGMANMIMRRMAPGSRRPLFLGSGIDIKQLQLDPSNTQFIDLMRVEVENVARFWGVPPSMIYSAVSGQSVTYANVSQADLAFLKTSVEAWIIDLEDAWSELLPQPRFVKFNTDAVLRMDTQTRFAVHEVALRNRLASVNELRAYENRPAWPDPIYDEPGLPAPPAPNEGASDDSSSPVA
jgi:HK97 family phage portal protein